MLHKLLVGRQNVLKWLCATAFLLCLPWQSHASESIALSWDPTSNPAAAGIYIYYGTSSHNYANIMNAGNTNQIVISGLNFGTTYYFAAQTYDSSGNESALSSEVSFVAGSANLTPANIGGQRMAFSVEGTPGQQYIIQSSSDLVHWTPFLTNTAPFQYTTTPNPAIAQQYFRACRYN